MRQAPFRPGNEMSQTYNSGLVKIYRVTDQGEPGYAPVPRLELRVSLRYEEQKLGLIRFYSAKQVDVQVEKVIRVPRRPDISPQDVACTEDGRLYKIELVQLAQGVYPPSLDLTLAKVEQNYEFPGPDSVSNSDTTGKEADSNAVV